MSQKSYDRLFLMHNCNIHMFRSKCREFHILSGPAVYCILKREGWLNMGMNEFSCALQLQNIT